MTSNNTCPYCGSAEDPELSGRYFRKFKCDSTQWTGGDGKTVTDQSEDCMRIELSALRSQNRDLQQAYDHVLECEQSRCREVVELQDKLSEVNSERDALSRRNRSVPNMKRQSTPTNCFRTCVAQILGLEIDAVPLGCDGASWDWGQFQDWLAERGLQAVEIGFSNGGTLYNVQSPVPCIITGQSPRECKTGMHAVVGLFTGLDGFEINGDPHPSEMWIDGEPTHAVFFVPINPRCTDELTTLKASISAAPAFIMVQRRGDVPELFEQECEATRFRYTERVRILPEPEDQNA